jgi:rod shape-determining protein MreC
MDFLTQYKNALFLIVVLVAQAIGLAMQVRSPVDASQPDGPKVTLLRLWAMAAVTPIERATHAIGHGVRYGWSDYLDLRHVRQQNKDLEQQLTRVRLDEAAIAEDALEGRRLQALLGFREKYISSTVAAQVIGTSGSEQSHVLIIDKGSNDGLRPDMPVITPNGIVGKLRDVSPTNSQVLEINDQSSGAGVVLASSRIRAILRGTIGGRAQIGNLTADSRIKPGETVLTSGGDQIYPRGLPVGVIESITPDPDHQPYTAIRVKPAVDLDQVDEVLVITGIQPGLSPAAQQDLDDAEAQHAADVSAERLPSIHDDEAPGTGANAAVTPGAPAAPAAVLVPHPVPALHTDRFSTGATPPAAQLTPGAPHTTLNNIAPSSPPANSTEQSTPPASKPASKTGTSPGASSPASKAKSSPSGTSGATTSGKPGASTSSGKPNAPAAKPAPEAAKPEEAK